VKNERRSFEERRSLVILKIGCKNSVFEAQISLIKFGDLLVLTI